MSETTTKIDVDLTELKKEFKDAQRHIQLVNSEFKASTASMDKWSDNADGLSAKLKQLNGVLDAEKTKLKSLEQQYSIVSSEQGENSKAAQDLMIKINNQKAAVDKVQSSINKYTQQLNDMKAASKETASATDKLKQTIDDQEKTLAQLKSEYSNLALGQKGSSQEAKDLAKQIFKLSGELKENKSALSDAENAADEFDRSLDDVGESAKDSADGFTVMKGAIADLIADGIKSAISAFGEFITTVDRAYNKFQAQTGASAEEMKDFRKEMDELYTNAYGETLEEIGDKMAYVKQVTGEVDASKIKELAENAIALEDTFGSDFNETIRGVNNLMTHFGISSEEAFDLFAKGSQLGLDYTGELGDNIAEYGGNFEQAGYSAEEYFQLLINGSQNGAYNLDKVNDSINEVKNRIGDGTIEKNIDIFSDGTKKAFEAWKDGKGTMKDVIDSIVNDINNCENEQEALNMAATAFGTMGEDANLKVVKSLKTTGDQFKNVKGTMTEMKNIRYDDVGTRFTVLGRTLKKELIEPLALKAIPYFEKFANYAIENIDSVVTALTVIGTTMGVVFAVNKVANFIQSIHTMVTTFNALKTALTAAETAQKLLNIAQLAMPAVALTAALAALAGGIIYLNQKNEEAIEKEYGLNEAQQESIEKSQQLKSSYDELAQSRSNSLNSINNEYGYLNTLKDEYNTLIDSNGKVKKGYEDRANFILNQLAEALGVEVSEIQNVIDKNGQLGESIDQIIMKKQAEASLTAAQAGYQEAIQKSQEALTTYVNAQNTAKEAQEKFNSVSAEGSAAWETYNELIGAKNYDAARQHYMANRKVMEGFIESKNANEEAQKALKDAEAGYIGYQSTIQNYEGLSAAIISGDSEKIQNSLQNLQNSFITAEVGTKSTLENQVKNTQKAYDDMLAAVEAGIIPMESAQVQGAREMVEKATAELNKYEENARKATEKAGTAAADGLKSKVPLMLDTSTELGKYLDKGLALPDTAKTAKKKLDEYAGGASSKSSVLFQTGEELSDTIDKGLGTADTEKTGEEKTEEYRDGIDSVKVKPTAEGKSKEADKGFSSVDMTGDGKNATGQYVSGIALVNPFGTAQGRASQADSGFTSVNMVKDGKTATNQYVSGMGSVSTFGTGEGRAKDAKSGMDSVDASPSGRFFGQGFINGLASMAQSAWNAGWNFVKRAWAGLKAGQKEGSPSKLTYQSGLYFVEGFVNAVSYGTKLAVKSAKSMGKEAIDAINSEIGTGIDVPSVNNFKSSVVSTRKAARSAMSGNNFSGGTTTNTYNFYQTNNSPKALSRLEIYRQTRNQLNFAKGVR